MQTTLLTILGRKGKVAGHEEIICFGLKNLRIFYFGVDNLLPKLYCGFLIFKD